MWSTGITVSYGYAGSSNGIERYGWTANLEWQASASNGSPVEGTIHTRYAEDTLEKAIDMVMEMANQFGVQFQDLGKGAVPCIYCKYETADEKDILLDNWKQILNDEARRRKWISYKVDEFGFESYAIENKL